MLTRYLSSVAIRDFNPFAAASKSTRILLSLVQSEATRAQAQTRITIATVPRTATTSPRVAVTYKDGKVVEFDAGKMSVKQLVFEIDRHSRELGIKDAIS